MKGKTLILLVAAVLFLMPKINFGQAPDLGHASSFALFTATGAFTNTGTTTITGDIGTNAGAFTGFPPGTVIGSIHVADATSALAATSTLDAYGYMSTLGGSVIPVGLGNDQLLVPGIYQTGAASTLNGNLILDGQGDPDALFIIRIGGALATSGSAEVILINSASPNNVYWQIGGQFDLTDGSVFKGTLIVDGAINLLGSSSLVGRGLSVSGAITTASNEVILGSPPAAPTVTLTQPTCILATGTITVTAPTGAGMTYSIDGLTYQASATFSGLTDRKSVV